MESSHHIQQPFKPMNELKTSAFDDEHFALETYQLSKIIIESHKATNKQIVRLLHAHRESLAKQVEQFENGLKSNLESYEATLQAIVDSYKQKRQEAYHQALAQLMIIQSCHKPEILNEIETNGVANHE